MRTPSEWWARLVNKWHGRPPGYFDFAGVEIDEEYTYDPKTFRKIRPRACERPGIMSFEDPYRRWNRPAIEPPIKRIEK